MFNLEIEMSTEPVIEPRLLNVTCCFQLHGDPIAILVIINLTWNMTHLSGPHEPVALDKPDEDKSQLSVMEMSTVHYSHIQF